MLRNFHMNSNISIVLSILSFICLYDQHFGTRKIILIIKNCEDTANFWASLTQIANTNAWILLLCCNTADFLLEDIKFIHYNRCKRMMVCYSGVDCSIKEIISNSAIFMDFIKITSNRQILKRAKKSSKPCYCEFGLP